MAQAEFNVKLVTSNSTEEPVTYYWTYGDMEVDVFTSGVTANATHKYMTIKEAGFTVNVTASTPSGINVAAQAMVIIYKPIQRKCLRIGLC